MSERGTGGQRLSTEQGTPTDTDATQKLRRPGTQTGQRSTMQDGAMARTAPRRDLERRTRVQAPGDRAGGGGATSATANRAPRPAPRDSTARPAGRRPARRSGPRRVRLTLQRVDPWSVMKISFLVSVALGIASVIMVAVLWTVLSGMNVFSTVNDLIVEITTGESSATTFDLMDYVGLGRVLSLAVVVGVLNVILLTAMATLTAFLYNVCTALVGGAQLTLADE
ncbi:MAG: DUF3566 domain-containing protein [Actinomycetota bacterium]|jgi:hypothetical protein|nr:DUF3566 domain-containing protein [Actinomycetota bacterium]MDQ3527740.1 DUF3566 domain-containing protein [Actinomycetota bacterium]